MKESIVSLTRKLIEFRTVEKDRIAAAAEFCAEWLAGNGVNARIVDNEGLKSVVATAGEGPKTIILNGHIDVVPASADQFIPYVADGKLFGRGSYDMLGSCAVMMHVAAALIEKNPSCRVILALVPDEEKGGHKGTKYLVDHGMRGDVVICGETTNLHIAVQAKGVLQIEIIVDGESAHGSRPWLGDNAILKAVDTYKRIAALPVFNVSTPYFEHPSLNLARIEAGQAINQVPDRCRMDLDIRYLPGQDPAVLLDEINQVVDGTVKVLNHGEPVQTNPEHPHIQLLKRCAENMKGSETKLYGQHGAADTRFYAAHGIPSVEFGPVGANHHGRNEHVDIASLETFYHILLDYIDLFGKEGGTDGA